MPKTGYLEAVATRVKQAEHERTFLNLALDGERVLGILYSKYDASLRQDEDTPFLSFDISDRADLNTIVAVHRIRGLAPYFEAVEGILEYIAKINGKSREALASLLSDQHKIALAEQLMMLHAGRISAKKFILELHETLGHRGKFELFLSAAFRELTKPTRKPTDLGQV
jgi:hypothetical protein